MRGRNSTATFVNMAASRIGSAAYICRKYQFFFIISFFLVGLQLVLVYNFSRSQPDVEDIQEYKKKIAFLENYHKGADDPLPHENVINGKDLPRDIKLPPYLQHKNNSSFKASRASRLAEHRKKMLKELYNDMVNIPGAPPIPVGGNANISSAVAQNGDEIEFVPKCDVTNKDAISALQRARTYECKKNMADAYCHFKEEKLYPMKLPRYCPLAGQNGGQYLGCYKDNRNHRILSGHRVEFKADNSPKKCINHCLRVGFNQAGVQFGFECFCGDLPSKSSRLPESHCDTLCPGVYDDKCGGFQAMNVYHTGYGEKAKNPSDFIRPDDLPADTEKARIVFVLTVNGRALRQIKRLLKAIYHSHHYYYIHVDKRQEYLFRELTALAEDFPNMRIASERFATIWGGASLLTMHLQCMKDLLAMGDWDWDFFINLSESDYPIKGLKDLQAYLTAYKDKNFLRYHGTKTYETVEELIAYLSVQNNKNFVRSHGKDTNRFIRKQGLNMLFYECDTHMWRLGERPLQDGIRVDGGSDWFCLNRKFTQYVVGSEDDLLTGLKGFWKYSLLPAESFFHTVLQNSAHCGTWVNNNLHLTNWRRKQGCKCQYKHIVDWCGCSPNDFMPEDFSKIKATENKPIYFARKFEAIINQEILNELDAYLFGPYPEDTLGLNCFWQNDYHHLDTDTKVEDHSLTAYHSFARLGTYRLAQRTPDLSNNKACILKPKQLLEIHLYNHADRFQGLLVKYIAEWGTPGAAQGGGTHTLETFVQPQSKYRVIKTVGPIKRLKYIEVGTSFDPKEEVFRNFGNLLGPHSDLKFKMEWGPGKAMTFTVAYIDPANVIAASYEIPVKDSETDTVQVHSPEFFKPMRPGVWTLRVLYVWEIVAESHFLVLPLTHKDGKVLSSTEKLINIGPREDKYTKKDFLQFKDSLQIQDSETKVKMRQARDNAEKRGQQLDDWVDEVVRVMWKVSETCVALADSHQACRSLPACEHTKWSSMSPDPKSEINGISSETGKIR